MLDNIKSGSAKFCTELEDKRTKNLQGQVGCDTNGDQGQGGHGKEPESITPCPKEAVDFLRKFHPGGPWVITSITVDQPTTTVSVPKHLVF